MIILSSRMNLRNVQSILRFRCTYLVIKAVQSAVHTRADIGLVEVDAELPALAGRQLASCTCSEMLAETVITFEAWNVSMQEPGAPIGEDRFSQRRWVSVPFVNSPH